MSRILRESIEAPVSRKVEQEWKDIPVTIEGEFDI
jgi:hypothetical protein